MMCLAPRVARIVLVLVLCCLAGQRAYTQGTHIRSIAPTSGRAGDTVTITGGGFGALNVRVTVGGIAAAVLSASGDHVTFVVPVSVRAGIAAVTATNPGGRAATVGFEVLGSGLLPGDPGAPALDAVFDLPPVAVGKEDIEGNLIMSRLDIQIAPDATTGQVNAALQQVGGRIVSMAAGLPAMTIGVPRQPNVPSLSALVTILRSAPGIAYARLALTIGVDELPSPDAAQLDTQLLPTGFPAAWNAKNLVVDNDGNCLRPRIPVVIPDSFPKPAPAVNGTGGEVVPFALEIPHLVPSPPDHLTTDAHGIDVTLVLAALFNGAARTGANPFSQCLDIVGVQVDGLSRTQFLQRLALNFPAGKFIMNYSLNAGQTCADGGVNVPCAPRHFGTVIPDALSRATDTMWWKYYSHSRWSDFLVATSAGNARNKESALLYPALGSAVMNSPINASTLADPLLGFAEEVSRWTPTSAGYPNLAATPEEMRFLAGAISTLGLESVAGASNVLMAGSTSLAATPLGLVTSAFSNDGHDVSAVGEEILAHDGGVIAGTSYTAPQVAGLASYLWLLSPELRAEAAPIARGAVLSNTRTTPTARDVIDAYAAVLSLDQAVLPTPASAPIRRAILNLNNDAAFDELDLAAYRGRYLDAGGLPAQPTLPSYDRYDLNGDGFTGGPTKTGRFDLDRVGSTQFGATSYAMVSAQIEGIDVTFNETLLTDLQILCYYAYSGLYQGTPLGRSQIMQGLCVTPAITVDPAAVTLAPGATQQFSADVKGLADPRVIWTATGGTISATGLFTAGATPGPVTVRALSVVDPNTFGDAVVTVSGIESAVTIAVGGLFAPAGHIRAVVLATGFDVTRPVSDSASVLTELAAALQGVQVTNLSVQVQEPVAITFTAGDVRRLILHGVCGATIDATVGAVRRHPTNPGLLGNGTVNIVVCGATDVRMSSAEFVQIDGGRSAAIAVTADSPGFLFISNTVDSSIAVSGGSLAGMNASGNGNISLDAGNVLGVAVLDRNNLPAGLGAIRIGDVGAELVITSNRGFTDAEAQAFAAARTVLGRVTISGNVR